MSNYQENLALEAEESSQSEKKGTSRKSKSSPSALRNFFVDLFFWMLGALLLYLSYLSAGQTWQQLLNRPVLDRAVETPSFKKPDFGEFNKELKKFLPQGLPARRSSKFDPLAGKSQRRTANRVENLNENLKKSLRKAIRSARPEKVEGERRGDPINGEKF